MKIGVISDTHNFLDPGVRAIFAGVEHILHAGDIGRPGILLALEEIAPVIAVLGNTDEAGFGYALTQSITLADRKFLLHHIVDPHKPSQTVSDAIARENPDVIVFGHTHKPFAREMGGRLYFNPGYAGKRRFGLERSVAILHCAQGELRPEYVVL